jgi:hypothetical protein
MKEALMQMLNEINAGLKTALTRVNELVAENKALKEALAQPEQEPVAWITPDGEGFRIRFSPPVNDVPLGWDALYTSPPQRTWTKLTDEEAYKIYRDCGDLNVRINIARAIEAKLKEKNT